MHPWTLSISHPFSNFFTAMHTICLHQLLHCSLWSPILVHVDRPFQIMESSKLRKNYTKHGSFMVSALILIKWCTSSICNDLDGFKIRLKSQLSTHREIQWYARAQGIVRKLWSWRKGIYVRTRRVLRGLCNHAVMLCFRIRREKHRTVFVLN